MTPLLPERAGCPQCGSTEGKRWRSYSGIELCTDCEWDYLSELNGRKLLDAAQAAKATPSRPIRARGGSEIRATSLTPSRPGANPATTQDWHKRGSPSSPVRSTADIRPGYNSTCRACGHIFYGAAMSNCTRCGGLCELRSDHDLNLMSRYAHPYIEAER